MASFAPIMKKANGFKQISYILVLFLGLQSEESIAQWNPDNQEVFFYIGGGVTSFKPVWTDLNQLTESYNANFGAQLQSKFSGFDNKTSGVYEFGLTLGNSIDLSIRKQIPTTYTNSATFQNGETREFKFQPKMTELNMAFNIFHIKKIYFGALMGAIFEKGKLSSGYKYKNGFVSYGVDKRLNAIFQLDKSLMTTGLQAYFVPHQRVALSFQWQKVGILRKFFASTITAATGELKDNLDGIGTFYSNHAYTTYLANSHAGVGIPDTYFTGLAGTANANFGGNRFLLTARINLKIVDFNEK